LRRFLNAQLGLALLMLALLAASFVVNLEPSFRDTSSTTVILNATGQGGVVWASTRNLSANDNAIAHFERHGRALGYKTAQAYVNGASAFLHHPPAGVQTKRQADGDIVHYRRDTAEFAVMREDGTPRTYFKLDRGLAANDNYFAAQ
jgi:pyocin large subunit-like protein